MGVWLFIKGFFTFCRILFWCIVGVICERRIYIIPIRAKRRVERWTKLKETASKRIKILDDRP